MGFNNHKRKMSISLSITLICPSNGGQHEHLDGRGKEAQPQLMTRFLFCLIPQVQYDVQFSASRVLLKGLMSGLC